MISPSDRYRLGQEDVDIIDAALTEQRKAVVHLLAAFDGIVERGERPVAADLTHYLAKICAAVNQIDERVHDPSGDL
jgi:hypothetical protein